MSTVMMGFSISLDGFIASAEREDAGLHDWLFAGDTPIALHVIFGPAEHVYLRPEIGQTFLEPDAIFLHNCVAGSRKGTAHAPITQCQKSQKNSEIYQSESD